MSRDSALAAMGARLAAVYAERDELAAGCAAALAEVERLREQVVRLHAELQVLEEARATAGHSRRRGLASLIRPEGTAARGA